MKRIELAVFDMAGTTVSDNSEVEFCFAQSLKQAGLVVDDSRIKALQGWSKRTVFELLWGEKLGSENPEVAIKADENYALFREILETHYANNPATPQPHALELFAYLRSQNIKIALTTGFYRKIADILLGQLGWTVRSEENPNGIIDCTLCGDDVENGRPAPDMIFLAMKRLGVENVNAVMKVGDTPSDLLAGDAAKVGLNFGVLNGTHTKEQLMKYAHNGLLNNLSEVPTFIDESVFV